MKSARLRPIVDTEPCEFPKWKEATPFADGVDWTDNIEGFYADQREY